MNIELLFLFKKHTDTLIEQTKSRPKQILKFSLNKQMESFSFSPLINLVGEGKRLLAVTGFEANISVLTTTDENNSFSITIPGHWNSKTAKKTIDELLNLIELSPQNCRELNVEQLRKKGIFLINGYFLTFYPVLVVLKMK